MCGKIFKRRSDLNNHLKSCNLGGQAEGQTDIQLTVTAGTPSWRSEKYKSPQLEKLQMVQEPLSHQLSQSEQLQMVQEHLSHQLFKSKQLQIAQVTEDSC